MNDSTHTSSGFSLASLVVPVLTGVIGFAAGYMADSLTGTATGGPKLSSGTINTSAPAEPRDGVVSDNEAGLDGSGPADILGEQGAGEAVEEEVEGVIGDPTQPEAGTPN